VSTHLRVVWSEGMLLSPQHLQQWDRYGHHLLAERFRAAHAFDWGLTHVEIDPEALRNGRIALTEVRGVLPDGTPFSAPQETPLPAPRTIQEHFPARLESLAVHVGLPAARDGRAQLGTLAQLGAPGPRYAPDRLALRDENLGSGERDVTIAHPNLCVLFPDDAVSEYDALPVAELQRSGENAFTLRREYVPPCLAVGGSERLVSLLTDVRERLETTGNEFSAKRRESGDTADFAVGDLRVFGYLASVNAWLPVFRHFVTHRRAHPEQVYLALASLVGELCTFSARHRVADLPAYDHAAPGEAFNRLHAVLAELLVSRGGDKSFHVELKRENGALHVGLLSDPRHLEPSTSLFLGARAEMEAPALLRELPARIKIGSRDQIDFIVAQALRGVPIEFVQVPPALLPRKATYFYFKLDPSCDAWEGVRKARNIAIYAPTDLPGLSLELVGLRD